MRWPNLHSRAITLLDTALDEQGFELLGGTDLPSRSMTMLAGRDPMRAIAASVPALQAGSMSNPSWRCTSSNSPRLSKLASATWTVSDPTCYSDGVVEPAPSDPGAGGLADNPDGPSAVLGCEDIHGGFAWNLNQDGTVTKLDLVTGPEVSRYRVGLAGDWRDSPSRTAVEGRGNAYVACRAHVDASWTQGSVSKMAGDARYGVDRNGDTTIPASTGPTALGLGKDECVIWTVPVGEPGGIPRSLAIDAGGPDVIEGFPWVGLCNQMRFYRLDPGTGSVLEMADVNGNPYGAAIDSAGCIWNSEPGPAPASIQRSHTTTHEVQPRIAAPHAAAGMTDGITVAPSGRARVACWAGRYASGCDPATGTWLDLPLSGSADGGRGIAADLGYQRRIMIPRGTWTRDDHRCEGPLDSWGEVDWDVTAPPGQVTMFAASATTAVELGSAPTIPLAVIPTATPPASIEDAFTAAGVPLFPFLRSTVLREGGPGGTTPIFRSIHVQWHWSVMG